jgi:DNA gyrase subunit B
MNPETLWDTTLNPKTRTLLRITIDAARDAEATFEAILGKDAGSRFKMIQENAHRLELDL